MALDPNTQRHISTFVQSQFPRLYEEFGQTFIDFVTYYYEWMETEGPLYDSRRASDYQDIDTTVDDFIIYFKEKYLPAIQLETRSNVEFLLKHSLDVYRSRGTIRSIDLLFRLVFGVGADVYYPFNDVFQPSSGEWVIPRYIEVTTREDLNKFVGKEIEGITSGAIAFVESWVRKKSGAKIIDILYISTVVGTFETGERINATAEPFNLLECPVMIGSLTTMTIYSGGLGFEIGDVFAIEGSAGYGARGRIANVSVSTGFADFDLEDGGYGYTANAQVLVSEARLAMQNVVVGSNTYNGNYFNVFEVASQATANINYESAVGGYFANNDSIFTYYTNGSVMGTGICLGATNGNSTNGEIRVSILSGNLQANAIYNTGNVVSANVPVSGGYNNTTATGNVIAESLTFTIDGSVDSGSFLLGETLVQNGSSFGTLAFITIDGPLATFGIEDRVGIWTNTTFTGQLSGAVGTADHIKVDLGLIDLTNQFFGDERAPITTSWSNTTGRISFLYTGSGANYAISNTLLYPETINFNTDYIADYSAVALNVVYNFPAYPTANLATLLVDAFQLTEYTIGSISALQSITPGTEYNAPPLTRVLEPISFTTQKNDINVLQITDASGSFQANDLITQSGTNARGLIVSANSETLIVKKYSLFNEFAATSNSTTYITANNTGATANISLVDGYTYATVSKDISGRFLGYNAVITANTSSVNGSITEVQIVASGWGYEDGESLSITSSNGTYTATGIANLGEHGRGLGFYRNRGGFLSDTKKIHDNDYYQVSSYEVRASVAFDRYRDMLKQLLHVAGTKAFGAFVYRQTANLNVNILNASITQT